MAKLHPQTGPVTTAGKEISSCNATTHGGTSEKLIVAGERQEDFDALLNDLVEDAALARWFLWRRQRAFGRPKLSTNSLSSTATKPPPSAP